ncbi:hypothetical protein JNUCC83_00400 [Vagococcus sp. JNUCC 83]
MEDDYIMRQIRLASEGIARLFKKDISKDFLGEVQKEDSSRVSRMDLVLEHVDNHQYHEAFLLVNALKFKMSLYDFQQVTDWFIKLLRERHANYPLELTSEDIETYKTKLNALL